MQLLNVSGTTAVPIGTSPFFEGQEVLMISAAALTLQGSDDGSTGWTTIGAVTVAGVIQQVTLNYPFIRVSTAGLIQLFNN